MPQKDKELLLMDLCARLPYETIVQVNDWTILDTTLKTGHITRLMDDDIKIKPYLRPISSMTEEEKKEFDNFCVIDEFAWKGNVEIGYKNQAIIMSDAIDWLLKKHFDYRGLIPKGLAIAVTKENNPYEN